MTAKIISGREVAEHILENELSKKVEELKGKNIIPNLVVISASNVPCSKLPAVNPAKLVNSACKFTSGKDGNSGCRPLTSSNKDVTLGSKLAARDLASAINPAGDAAVFIISSNLLCSALN